MGLLAGRGRRTINLIVKDHVIRYMDSKQPDLRSVQAFGEKHLPSGVVEEGKIVRKEQFRSILAGCVQRWKIKRREVQFVVPDSLVVVRKVQIPADIPDSEVKGHLYLELGTTIHLPFENPIFDIDLLGEKNNKKEVLLFAAPEQAVMDYALAFEQAGLRPTVADVSSLAIYRLYSKTGHGDGMREPILAIQFDLQTVTASFFKHEKLVFMRELKMNVPIESWTVTADRAGNETVAWNGDEEYLAYEVQAALDELGRLINYYHSSIDQENETISRILLTGDHPHIKEFADRIKSAFQLLPLTFDKDLFESQAKDMIPSKYDLPLGLSLKGGL